MRNKKDPIKIPIVEILALKNICIYSTLIKFNIISEIGGFGGTY